ncbi:uncharacterized protein LOC133712710 [Rosa rugosa]|uniref:uncharacterized protein LOC133712710 n=1 Tax=Rosa rugosa TaxID=74645 RepID=UPI002B4093A1|nr:uncharacterized protein LOC133712710 [Rosa rugosa]
MEMNKIGFYFGSRFYSGDEFRLDSKWLIDPKHLFVGPRIGEGAHDAKVYEGKYKNQTVAIKVLHKGETPEEITKRQDKGGLPERLKLICMNLQVLLAWLSGLHIGMQWYCMIATTRKYRRCCSKLVDVLLHRA